jgi:dynactin 1
LFICRRIKLIDRSMIDNRVLAEGCRVSVREDTGIVRFIGPTSFSSGQWVGIELDAPRGKNDGSVKGIKYFECRKGPDDAKFGLFVRKGMVKFQDDRPKSPPRESTPRVLGSPVRSISRVGSSAGNMLLGKTPMLPPSLTPRSPSIGRLSPRSSVFDGEEGVAPGDRRVVSSPGTRIRTPSVNTPVASYDSLPPLFARQMETLKSKLKIMERKRLEDKEKIQFMQTEIKNASRLENIIRRLQLKLTPMHDEIKKLRAKLAEVESENFTLTQDRYDEILELATVDKEIAEERSENLVLELEALRQKFEQLELECEILREENALYSNSDPMIAESGNILLLEKRNKKLEEALLRLRQLGLSQESSFKEKIASLEKDLSDNKEIISSQSHAAIKLAEAESIILELRQQLDNALGAEEMIESLTVQNLELSDKCKELQSTIEELETLKELGDELDANHIHRERQLLVEIESLQSLHNDNRFKLDEVQSRNSYLEAAVVRFRDLVVELNLDLSRLKSNEHTDSGRGAKDHTKAIMDLNLKLVSTSIEFRAKTMDLELYKFTSQQALEQLEIMKCYLPAEYASDERSVSAYLHVGCIAFQASLVESYVKDHLSNDMRVNVPICLALAEIRALASKLSDAMRYSDPEKFRSFAMLSDQTAEIEQSLNADIELLRKEELNGDIYVKSLSNLLPKMKAMADVYSNTSATLAFTRLVHVQALMEYLYIVAGEQRNELSVVFQARSAISKLVEDFKARKTEGKAIAFSSNDLQTLEKLKDKLGLVLVFLVELYYHTDDDEEQTVDDIYQKHFGMTNKEGLLSIYLDSIKKIKELSLKKLPTIELPQTPWDHKAHQIQNMRSNQRTMDKELELLRQESQRLSMILRGKDRNIEELEVKIGLLNSKLATSKEQDNLIANLKKSLSDAIAQEKRLSQSLDHLKKTAADQDKKLADHNLSENPTTLRGGELLSAVNMSALTLQREVHSLRSAVGFLSQENNSLKTQRNLCGWLQPLPTKSHVKKSLLYNTCRPVFRWLRDAVAEFDLVTFRPPDQHLWRSSNSSPKVEYLRQEEGLTIVDIQISRLI